MEQGNRLDSTLMSAAQDVRDDAGEDRALDAAVAALLTSAPGDALSGNGVGEREHGAPSKPAETVSPVLADLLSEWSALQNEFRSREMVDEELDQKCDRANELHAQICAFKARSSADMRAKAPLYRHEYDDVRRGGNEDSQEARALLSIIRDIEAIERSLQPTEKDHCDAELIEIGQSWPGLVAEMKRTLDRLDEANEAYEAPKMPRELQVYGYDVAGGFPLPHRTAKGYAPYGLNQIEELRATPRMGVFIGGKPEGELLEGGGYRRVDKHAQTRAETIIAAWDNWRAEVYRRELALDIPALRMAARTATEAQDAAALRARALKAHTTRGLIAKAEIAAGVIPWRDRDAEAARRDADDEVGILYTLGSDALRVLGGRDPQLVRAS